MTSSKPVDGRRPERMIPTFGSDPASSAVREVQGWPRASMEDSVASALHGAAIGIPCAKKIRRYTLCKEVAYGGTAAVHLGLLEGAAGFRRPVAIKRIREGLPKERRQSAGLMREALLGCHIRHPNVVPILDLVQADGELLLVMEFVLGETLSRLQKASGKLPLPIIVAILCGALRGLHAAHIATGDAHEPLKIVHRDVSPQNVLVGADGIARIIDFGVAKAVSTEQTSVGYLKGKIGYFAPEQFLDEPLDARTDVFAAGIVLWEALAGRRLFQERNPVESVLRFLSQGVEPASTYNPDVPKALDSLLARALQRSPEWRFESAEAFADALERVVRPASPGEVALFLQQRVGAALEEQRALLSTVQLPGARRAAMSPVTTAHGSISFPMLPGAGAQEDELTLVQRPRGARAGLLSTPDSFDDFTEVEVRPEPLAAVQFQDLTKPDLFPQVRHGFQELRFQLRILILGLALGAALGAAVTWQLFERAVLVASRAPAAAVKRADSAAVVTKRADPALEQREPAPETLRLVPVNPETLALDAAPAAESVKSKRAVKARSSSRRRPAKRRTPPKTAPVSARACEAAPGDGDIDPACT